MMDKEMMDKLAAMVLVSLDVGLDPAKLGFVFSSVFGEEVRGQIADRAREIKGNFYYTPEVE